MPLFLLNYISIFLMIFLAEKKREVGTGQATYQLIVWITFSLGLANFLILAL
jgi:hypothetical protein